MYLITDAAELLPTRLESLESTLISSHKCYNKALSLEPTDMDRNNLLRRLGNIHNELGVLFMNQAGGTFQMGGNCRRVSSRNDGLVSFVDRENMLYSAMPARETSRRLVEFKERDRTPYLLTESPGSRYQSVRGRSRRGKSGALAL